MADQGVVPLGDQGEHHVVGGTQGVHEVGLLRSSEGLLIHMPDRTPVVRPLIANDDVGTG